MLHDRRTRTKALSTQLRYAHNLCCAILLDSIASAVVCVLPIRCDVSWEKRTSEDGVTDETRSNGSENEKFVARTESDSDGAITEESRVKIVVFGHEIR